MVVAVAAVALVVVAVVDVTKKAVNDPLPLLDKVLLESVVVGVVHALAQLLLVGRGMQLVLSKDRVLLNKTYPTDINTIVNFKKLNLTFRK